MTIHSLAKLSWITRSNSGVSQKYIQSVKIPALEVIFDKEFESSTLRGIQKEISAITKLSMENIVTNRTGFTNFRPVFRNSSLAWCKQNEKKLIRLITNAFNIDSDHDALSTIRLMDGLPKIQKPVSRDGAMASKNFLSPLLFSLDKRIRFPIMNGNDSPKAIIKALGVEDASLTTQYKEMVKIIDLYENVKDAADLDMIGHYDLSNYVTSSKSEAKFKKAKSKSTNLNNSLSIKDEKDVIVVSKSLNKIAKRVHNQMTNAILRIFTENGFICEEGATESNRFDVWVIRFPDVGESLLIEVKSSSDISNVRMAIGQLLDYHRQFINKANIKKAILLPEKPDDHVIELLKHVNIGLMYFSDDDYQAIKYRDENRKNIKI